MTIATPYEHLTEPGVRIGSAPVRPLWLRWLTREGVDAPPKEPRGCVSAAAEHRRGIQGADPLLQKNPRVLRGDVGRSCESAGCADAQHDCAEGRPPDLRTVDSAEQSERLGISGISFDNSLESRRRIIECLIAVGTRHPG